MSPSGVPARSTGFLMGQCGLSMARSFSCVASESTGASKLLASQKSVAITPCPPPSVRTAMRLPWAGLHLEKASAASNSSLKSAGCEKVTTPARARAASKIFSLPARGTGVCNGGAGQAAPQPILMAAMGLLTEVRRAASETWCPSSPRFPREGLPYRGA